MEETLNATPKISSLKLLTFSELVNNIDQSRENNKKSQYTFLNLNFSPNNFSNSKIFGPAVDTKFELKQVFKYFFSLFVI